MKALISIKNLSVTYFRGKSNEVRALANVSLDIFPGEFIIFFGPSGCGKSTLLYAIAGLERNIDGDILVDGQAIGQIDADALSRYNQQKIGMIFQAYYLIPSLNVLQNVILPQMAIGGDIVERRQKSLDLLRHFGVEKQKDKLPQELSGGQQQRVAICRALINDPDIILADEPVGNLDSKSAEDVLTLLRQLNVERKKTVILVTHDPSHLHIADRVFYLKDGQHYDTKVNQPSPMYQVDAHAPVPKDLELLSKTFRSIKNIHDDMSLNAYKSRHIVLQTLTGLSVEEIDGIQERVDQLLSSGSGNYETIFQYLDKNQRLGGLDLDKRRARKLSDEIGDLSKKVHQLMKKSAGFENDGILLAEFLKKKFDLKFGDQKHWDRFVEVIVRRLKNTISLKEVFENFDAPWSKGGLGFDVRQAHKLSRHVELLMLGKYQLMQLAPTKTLPLLDRRKEIKK